MEPQNSANELNDAFLVRLFQFLPFEDRKNARLVCSSWHQASCRRAICRKEVLYISSLYSLQSILDFLITSSRESFNLRFGQRIFDSSAKILWDNCGHLIESLEFHNCFFYPDVLPAIFSCCEQLIEFTVHGGRILQRSCIPYDESFLVGDLIRHTLTKLHLCSPGFKLMSTDLVAIASAFPKLRNLDLYLKANDNLQGTQQIYNFYILLELVEKLQHLDKLTLNLLPRIWSYPLIDFADLQKKLSRLRSLSLTLDPFQLSGQSLNTIWRYAYWTKVSFYHCELPHTHVMLLVRLLGSNHRLEELELRWVPKESKTQRCEFSVIVIAIISSKLKSFRLSVDADLEVPFITKYVSEVEELMELNLLAVNLNLQVLKVICPSPDFCSFLVKYFPNVRTLCAIPGDANVIFESLPNLQCLDIDISYYIHPLSDSPTKLVNCLEYLKVRPLHVSLFSTYKMPKLKYLFCGDSTCLDVRGKQIKGQHLTLIGVTSMGKLRSLWDNLARDSPNLVAIGFRFEEKIEAMSYLVFFQSYVKKFPKLRHISMVDFNKSAGVQRDCVKNEAWQCLLKYPSLRSVWIDTVVYRCHYFKNGYPSTNVEFSDEFVKHFPDFPLFSPEGVFYDYWRRGH